MEEPPKNTESADDLSLDKLVALASLDIQELIKLLPPEERQRYIDNQQSIVHARDSAPLNEGQIYII